MNTTKTLYTTAAGRQRYFERVRAVRAQYDAVCASNEDAADAGDNSVWHDNFAYEENQRQMHALARRLRDMQACLSRMQVVSPPKDPTRVCLGSAVELENVDTGETRRWVIAGYEDGDLAAGRLSYIAPLARAVLGAEEGDERVLVVDGAKTRFEVVAIEAAEAGEL